MFKKVKTEKLCSLYVNEIHLIVMLMPYIEKELEKNIKVFTILEESLESEVDLFISKTNLTEEKRRKILSIDWKKTDISKIKNKDLKGKTVIIKGCEEYIEEINETLKNSQAKIINCFSLEKFEKNAKNILSKHDKILNTLGEQEISDVFHINLKQKTILT